MKTALSLARRGLGNVWPNPAVGCVIVKEGKIVGRGWTQPGGRPHAETMALELAGKRASGAKAYISLEPCNHTGETPPCAEALIYAGIKEVYASLSDPDHRVSGTGFNKLKAANIAVNVGLLKEEAKEINKGFFLLLEKSRPLITFKTATTYDGKIATKKGESNWITNEESRNFAHLLRATHDATLVGSGTVLSDDPLLTSRLPGISNIRRPRIVLDSRLRVPLDSKLLKTAGDYPVWLITGDQHSPKELHAFREKNVELILLPQDKFGRPNIKKVLQELANRGLTRVLVEGGNSIAQNLFKADLVDQIAWFRSPKIMGNDGLSAIGNLDLKELSAIYKFQRVHSIEIGSDSLEILRRSK